MKRIRTDLRNCKVYRVREAENIHGTEIVFQNTQSGKHRNLIISDNGKLLASQ